MIDFNYADTRILDALVKEMTERRQQVLEQLAAGVEFRQYMRTIGVLEGLKEAINIINAMHEDLTRRM